MVLHTLVKLKTLKLTQQIVTGAFINGALLGLGAAAIAATAMRGRGCGLCARDKPTHAPET
jgi:hypothetical protein